MNQAKNQSKSTVRLAKFLAEAGVASRRRAEELIKSGQVKIAGRIVDQVATEVSLGQKNITVANKPALIENKVYYLLNKPIGYVSSVSDPHNSQTVVDLVPKVPKVFPVGRLDKNSQGLLILTNDGDLAYRLTHPKFEVKKTYLVSVNKKLDKKIISLLKRGIKLEEGLAKADSVTVFGEKKLEIVIHQGFKRQIRRMLEELGYQVKSLTRIREGKLSLDNLASGQCRKLKLEDIL